MALLKEVLVIGLGPGSFDQLSLGAWQALSEGNPIYLRTEKHPVVKELTAQGIKFTSFDYLYEQKADFSEVYEGIAEQLISELKADPALERIIYAVPGHPLVGETAVKLLLEKTAEESELKVTILPAVSFVDSLINILQLDLISGVTILDALSFKQEQLNTLQHHIFTQVYSRFVASDLKLSLLEIYPADHPVTVIKAAGIPGEEKTAQVVLSELDHLTWYDHLTSVYLPPLEEKIPNSLFANYALDPLVNVLDKLLSPEGCPWDREQNHATLKPCLIEEMYEVIEAIDCQDMIKLKEELGDVLLQVVFHTALAQGRGDFDLNDVVGGITEKMIRRHPHVFGEVIVKNTADVLKNWEQIKKAEKGNNISDEKIMTSINKSLPALLMAQEVQKKARKVGFDWDDLQGPMEKVKEELQELEEAISAQNKAGKSKDGVNNTSSVASESNGSKISSTDNVSNGNKLSNVSNLDNVEEELGDLLFAVVNLGRFIKVSPEGALYKTIRKFIRRFNYLEQEIGEKGQKWGELDLQELDKIWERAKSKGL